MTSVHLYQAEKKDLESIYNLLVEYKQVDLADVHFPEIDRDKLMNFINTILLKGKIILIKDLDRQELIGTCMFNKAEYFFSKSKIMQIQMIYIKQRFRNYKLVKTLIDSVKKVSEDLPIVLSITSGLGVDPVFQRLGFENMGGNWRLS
tara:strand:+ start:588 stop:1031 length:444 start_codon:yes stop_codon:yes gene_type:complete